MERIVVVTTIQDHRILIKKVELPSFLQVIYDHVDLVRADYWFLNFYILKVFLKKLIFSLFFNIKLIFFIVFKLF